MDSRTVLTYFVVGTMLSFGVGFGLVLAIPPAPGPSPTALPPGPAFYENLTIDVNSTSGWPEYTVANFTVPAGRVIFTITDNDEPANWSGCSCLVLGTANNLELINGTATHVVDPGNVAHSFSVPKLGIQVWSPGNSVVKFSAEVTPGKFLWICEVPCGQGTDPYTSPPMGTLGFMTGYMTVT